MRESLYWVWLSLKLGPSSVYLNRLLAKFSSAKEIFEADEAEIRAMEKIPESVKIRLSDKSLDRAEQILELCRKSGIGVMTYQDPRYPRVLKYIAKPPAVLYFKGQPIDFDRRLGVAVVGTRKMSDYGRDMAYRFGYDLASAGAVIISGMALGVDGMAAAGALDAHMPTVAVLGGGVDVVYPAEHRKLYENILREGLILSEYPPGMRPDGSNFPQRNRIISGLARCTLVVECPESSGALITAEDSLASGRPLFAIPGAIGMPNSVGTNNLIKRGARITTAASDILDSFVSASFDGLDPSAIGEKHFDAQKAANRYGVSCRKNDRKVIKLGKRTEEPEAVEASSLGMEKELKANNAFVALAGPEKAIYDCLPEEGGISVDLIVSSTGQSVADVSMHLLSLRIKGAVVELPGGRYRRAD